MEQVVVLQMKVPTSISLLPMRERLIGTLNLAFINMFRAKYFLPMGCSGKAKERMVKANFIVEQLRDSHDPLRRGERWNVELGTTKAL